MKNIFILFVVFSIFGACKKEEILEDQSILNLENIDDLKKILTTGIWKISSITELKNDKIEEKSGLFSGIQFMFSNDKSMMAHKGSHVVNGLWKIDNTVIYYAQPSGLSAYSFTINLGDESPYYHINNQWIVKSFSPKQIKFAHSNPAENKNMLLIHE